MAGPLAGLRVIELAGIGPVPFCAMVLADLGADVVRVDRADAVTPGTLDQPSSDVLNRGRKSIGVDLKHPDGVVTVLRLVEDADVLIEGFRPGVSDRLGVGPDVCRSRNARLVYGRMTGWGQSGPWASMAGHDIDYIALSGVLHAIGRADERPVPPLNLVGDFGGGGLLLAFGVMAGVWEAQRSGQGQVIDASMVEGSALLSTMIFGMVGQGIWDFDRRGVNPLDGGAPWYDTYETSDGKFVAVGAIEPQFYAALLEGLDLTETEMPPQYDKDRWPELRSILAGRIRTRTREEWSARFAGTDACVAPVLSFNEARDHPHNDARGVFTEVGGIVQPSPAPRYSRTPAGQPGSAVHPGANTDAVLASAGFDDAAIRELRASGAVR
ncbi:MAG: CoA transferase [Acidimicrobiia bacterium]|nr:CoA transferase [Acidimicrobiia bacterium]